MIKQTAFGRRQRGVGMIEVVIALLIFSIGVLGFAALQMTALTQSNDANHRTIAVLIAQDAVERMQANPGEQATYLDDEDWPTGVYGANPPGDCVNVTEANRCSSEDMARLDMADLAWMAANQLPGGRIIADECTFNTDMDCVIVSWEEQDPKDCTTNSDILTSDDSKCFVLEVAQ